ncbi:MAG: hypothetical protein ACAI38_24040 [Myxococcota bacterium]
MRGFIRLRTLVFLALCAALAVVVLAYGRMALKYYRIKQEAIQLANSELVKPETQANGVDQFLFNVKNRTDLTLTRSDVAVKQVAGSESLTVEVHVVIPVTFVIVNRTRYMPFIIQVEAKRLKDF